MPLSRLQSDVLLALAAQRNLESYVAGAAALNRDSARFSQDIGIFHDREEAVARAADVDAALLMAKGFGVRWLRREPGVHAADVARQNEATRLEWARDSDFRFFPALRDELFGYRLHVADLATNKALAAAGRREPRDVLDLLFIHEKHLPLGAVIWAAVAKDPGFCPESLIAEIRRNARYLADDYAGLQLTEPVNAAAVSRALRAALAEAEEFARWAPGGSEGVLFLSDGVAIEPSAQTLPLCTLHRCERKGHWPSSSEIGGAILRG